MGKTKNNLSKKLWNYENYKIEKKMLEERRQEINRKIMGKR